MQILKSYQSDVFGVNGAGRQYRSVKGLGDRDGFVVSHVVNGTGSRVKGRQSWPLVKTN